MTAPEQSKSALNNLSDETGASTSNSDTGALGAAVSNLSISGSSANDAAKKDAKKEEAAKKIKIDDLDVKFLVEQLELNKVKATDLLKKSDGDRTKALRAFVVGQS